MSNTGAQGELSLRAGAFVFCGVVLSTAIFSVLSTFVLFRDSAAPALFAVASSVPLGINSYLMLSYVLGFLTSYVFFYQGGFDRLQSSLGGDR